MATKMNQFSEYISNSKKVLVITSQPLDLDCISSGILMKKYLEHLGLAVNFKFPRKLTLEEIEQFNYLPYFSEFDNGDTRDLINSAGFDVVILLDGSNWIQFFDYKNKELPAPTWPDKLKLIQIDHHANSSEIETPFKIQNSGASSTMEILLNEVIPLDFLEKELATLAYSGLVGDTGNFRWGFNSQTLKFAQILLEKGANPLETIERMFFMKTKEYIESLKYVLENIEYDDELKTVFLLLPHEKILNDKIGENTYKSVKSAFTYEVAKCINGYARGILIAEPIKKNSLSTTARGSNLDNKIDLAKLW